MRHFQALFMLLVAVGCQAGEGEVTVQDRAVGYILTELDGAAFTGRATIFFPSEDRVTGQAPCNRYFATLTAQPPAFALTRIGSTRRACRDLDLERNFLAALTAMTRIERSGDTLTLSNDAGRRMVFVAP